MAYRWETARSVWLECEHSGQFELSSSVNLGRIEWPAPARQRWPDMAQLLGAALPKHCAHAPLYPEDFAFCPTCGAALTSVASAPQLEWWGANAEPSLPKHVPQGLPVTALPLAAGIEARVPTAVVQPDVTIPAPPNAVCVFAAANFGFAAQRLLALAYTRNALQYWEPDPARWHLMTGEAGAASLSFHASDYAWLPASAPRLGEVALVPTQQGLFRLLIDPLALRYRTEPVFQAPLASAPGAVGQQIACLFTGTSVGTSGVKLWTAHADGADPEVLHCAGAIPASGWSRPISYDGKLMWLHAQGHLIWQPGNAPVWLAWPQGWTPRLNLGGPTQSRDGRLWLIGHDGQAYSFLELGWDPNLARGQIEAIDGARLGFGTFLFRRGHPVLNDPWDGETIEDPNAPEALVLPLLQNFNGLRNQPTGLVLRFMGYTGKAETALESAIIQKTQVEWIGRRNVLLDELIRLERPAACLPFVYDDCLWLHHPDWDRMRGWRLDALS